MSTPEEIVASIDKLTPAQRCKLVAGILESGKPGYLDICATILDGVAVELRIVERHAGKVSP